MKSGLRAYYAANRIETAEEIAKEVLRREFSGHVVQGKVEVERPGAPRFTPSKREFVTSGCFEIHNESGKVALVEIPDYVSGNEMPKKPIIHVVEGNKKLGKALAKAFKIHAKYWLSPRVRSWVSIPSSSDVLSGRESEEDFAKAERRRLRMR